MKKIIGQYSPMGYTVTLVHEDGMEEEFYAAGNNKFSSHTSDTLPPDHEHAVSLTTLEGYCKKTCLEIAKEKGVLQENVFVEPEN